MTRRDYELIAAALKSEKPQAHWSANKMIQWQLDCAAIAGALASTNPRFNRNRFLAACGIATASG